MIPGSLAIISATFPEDRRGKEEDEQRPPQRGHHQCRAEVADQDVLGHVRREQLLVGEPVERTDEGEERHRQPGGEERDPIPAGEVGAPAPAQPQHRLSEQNRSNHSGDDRNHALDCAAYRAGRSGHVSVSDT